VSMNQRHSVKLSGLAMPQAASLRSNRPLNDYWTRNRARRLKSRLVS
jgi:hypothetical protein